MVKYGVKSKWEHSTLDTNSLDTALTIESLYWLNVKCSWTIETLEIVNPFLMRLTPNLIPIILRLHLKLP